MYHLSINTACGFFVAIFNNDILQDSIVLGQKDTVISDNSVPLISKLLYRNNIKICDIEFITLINGPGFFTGVRIGIAIAKILKLSLNIPVITINSLEALAYQANEISLYEKEFYLSLIDIGKVGLIIALYNKNMLLYDNIEYLENKYLEKYLLEKEYINIEVIGQKQNLIREYKILKKAIFNDKIEYIDIKYVGQLGFKKYKEKKYDQTIMPIYIKDVDIKIKK